MNGSKSEMKQEMRRHWFEIVLLIPAIIFVWLFAIHLAFPEARLPAWSWFCLFSRLLFVYNLVVGLFLSQRQMAWWIKLAGWSLFFCHYFHCWFSRHFQSQSLWRKFIASPGRLAMKPKLLLGLALVLSGGLFGCSSAPKIHSATPMTTYDGETFTAPRKLRNGSASLPEVYSWADSVLGTNYPLQTFHADIFQNGCDDLFVAEPAWGGTGGNLHLAFARTRSGYRFVGDLWFGGVQIVSPDNRGRPRLITFSNRSSGSTRVALCYLDCDGFHEIMGRILPAGDGPHAEGKDWLLSRAFDFETGKPKDLSEPMLQVIFGDPATIEFSGSIKAGQRFEHHFGDRFIFALAPMQFGWGISVHEKGRAENLAGLTLPLHGSNPTDIEGWHFRNEDNTGSSNEHDAASGNDIRDFIFSPEVGKTINAPESTNNITEDDIDRIQAFGQGELKITRLKLSPPQLHGTANIEQMNFVCTLTWRRKDLEPMHPNTTTP